nr:hypothetical protein CFP56_41408 [Quercus suber]
MEKAVDAADALNHAHRSNRCTEASDMKRLGPGWLSLFSLEDSDVQQDIHLAVENLNLQKWIFTRSHGSKLEQRTDVNAYRNKTRRRVTRCSAVIIIIVTLQREDWKMVNVIVGSWSSCHRDTAVCIGSGSSRCK